MTTPEFSILVDLLKYRATYQPNQIAYTFLQDGEVESTNLSYQTLDQQAKNIAIHLKQKLIQPGDRVLLLYPSGLDFIAAFMGCLYAGVVAVPAYPPRHNQKLSRLEAIANDADPSAILTTNGLLSNLQRQWKQHPQLAHLPCVTTENIQNQTPTHLGNNHPQTHHIITADTLAFLQYTSGSTGKPKGVMVSHRNILANQEMIKSAFHHNETTVIASWLPLFHDMGLIGTILQPLYLGSRSILMSPTAFLQKPIRWLNTISHYRVTTSGGPNFAYDLCVKRITAAEKATLDLSSWRIAFNGAEPIHAKTLQAFTEAFSQCGFRSQTFYPCYGMAETTLLVSGGSPERTPVLKQVERNALKHNQVIANKDSQQDCQTLVGCGQTVLNQDIVIVDPHTQRPCPPNQVGEIWVTGAHVAQGYWGREAETQKTFKAHPLGLSEKNYLRTGDLGILDSGGELFITGRLKEVINIRGRNYYPYDIEKTVEESCSLLSPHTCIITTIEHKEELKPIAVVEVARQFRKSITPEVFKDILAAVFSQHHLTLHDIVILSPTKVPKTSSGKLMRTYCSELYHDQKLQPILSLQEASTPDAISEQPDRKSLEMFVVREVSALAKIPAKQIKLTDNISSLGLDSLSIQELAVKLEAAFSCSIYMDWLVSDPTLEDFIAKLLHSSSDETQVSRTKDATRKNLLLGKDNLLHTLSQGPIAEQLTKVPIQFLTVDAQNGREVIINNKKVIDFASCNYLGLDLDEEVMAAIPEAMKKWGVHPSWTRAVASPRPYQELETNLAKFVGAPDVAVFPNLAMTSIATLTSLTVPGSVIFLCQAAHNTIREAAELAMARGREICEFRYMDFDDLAQKMARYPESPKLIAVDGVYSMTSEFIDLPKLLAVAEQFDAQIYVDDAHGFGVIGEKPTEELPYGLHGNGIAKHYGIDLSTDRILYAAGLSKSFSSHAAFVTCANADIKRKLQLSSPYIFSGPVPIPTLASALKGLEINAIRGQEIRQRLFQLTTRLVEGARQLGYQVDNHHSFPAVFVVIGDLNTSIKAIDYLWEKGILLTPGLYPATSLHRCGIRLSVTANITEHQVNYLLQVLSELKSQDL
ncbi:aminotransferase class I/II-fold pyridoxal phosphate-dependent enzyme [Leptothoe spongobia]|uniref:Aminotransferase class I/II-fold pyridoxal phosphate-dependent enzyme n=1 Tax=Leptothoe spongobia TAU-MAC 1115 TaxID=1967444 RepID=A0A947DCY6_9CYAN|nr:aminotransferase class I/II-fold pyridoxal phosphate-dependent enzyme [Leptothoe spongobia]MBT9314810.1 aminotransferase class I/II-fold pyridoxal phosphate-dependent enzyme [Leptothoe spongobia TAU-MAC 1115]